MGLPNLATDIGEYFWPASVSGPVEVAKSCTKSLITKLKVTKRSTDKGPKRGPNKD